jgi:CheY-like chemotaxis protein
MPETRASGDELSEDSPRARILVVDDHALGRKLLERLLERDGHEVEAVASLGAALAVAADRTPDLVVLDLNLPDGDGLQLAAVLRDDPRTAGTPVIACTAAAAEEDRRRALRAGCDAYASKPIDTNEFASLVRELLSNRRPEPCGTSRRS